MMVRWYLFLFVGAFIALSLLSCEKNNPPPSTPREVASLVLVLDASTSSGDTSKSSIPDLRCSEVVGIVQQHLPQSKRLDVLVLATGGRATGSEPRIIVPWVRFAPTFKQFGPAASKAVQAEVFLAALVERCRGAVVQESSSPIVAAVSRGALSLTSHCAELTALREVCSSRHLVIVSDLRETVQSGVRERLVAVSKALRLGKPLPLRPPTLLTISLTGNLSVCGLSEHVAGRDDLAVVPEAVVTVWRELFDREVVFEPACPRFPIPPTHNVKTSGGVR